MKQYTDDKFETIDVKELLYAESSNQINKWGIQTHSLFEWLSYTMEELGSLSKAISEFEYRDGDWIRIYKEAIQVATLSLKIAEMVKSHNKPT